MAADPAAVAPALRDEPDARALPGGTADRLLSYAGFLPAMLLFGAFFLVPLGVIVAYSFWQVVDYEVVHDWTLDNYRYFFSVGTYVRTFWATLWVSAATTALTLAAAFPFAYWLVRH